MSEFKITATRSDNRNRNFPHADAWTVRITNPRGQVMQRQYYMGTGHNGRKPTLAEVMESLTTDAACVADTNLSEFLLDYGYEDYKDGRKVYNACKRTAHRLETFLTEDEWNQFAGYEDYKDGQKAYNVYKRTADRLETFTEDEWGQFTG